MKHFASHCAEKVNRENQAVLPSSQEITTAKQRNSLVMPGNELTSSWNKSCLLLKAFRLFCLSSNSKQASNQSGKQDVDHRIRHNCQTRASATQAQRSWRYCSFQKTITQIFSRRRKVFDEIFQRLDNFSQANAFPQLAWSSFRLQRLESPVNDTLSTLFAGKWKQLLQANKSDNNEFRQRVTYLTNLEMRDVHFLMTRADLFSSSWARDIVSPSSMWPSTITTACQKVHDLSLNRIKQVSRS